jgi:redox-sensitive bicupin YhaK (pirin superfamily)
MQKREVREVITPSPTLDGAGVQLRRSIATPTLDHLDPFFLFDHFGSENPDDYIAGFPMHPHRGIETATYMLAGAVTHRDSIGNAGTIGAGDVQWMTAGGGIMHEEMPQPVEGAMEGFQLWVNLPARLKMSRPRYQEISAEQVPTVQRGDGATLRVIAGSADEVIGPVAGIAADPVYLDIAVPAQSSFTYPVGRGHTTLAYLFRGQAAFGDDGMFGDAKVTAPAMLVFADGDQVTVQTGSAAGRFLLLSGLPDNEPIVRYGPFVMNTRDEIRQALQDLRNGTFIWKE